MKGTCPTGCDVIKPSLDFGIQFRIRQCRAVDQWRRGELHLERQTAVNDDLPVEDVDGIGNGNAEIAKDTFGLGFQIRLNSSIQVRPW